MPSSNQRQKQAFVTGGGDFDSDLSITHEVKVPSIDDILASVRAALASAQQTIDEQGGSCGCF